MAPSIFETAAGEFTNFYISKALAETSRADCHSWIE
jgi:hypothetical protein